MTPTDHHGGGHGNGSGTSATLPYAGPVAGAVGRRARNGRHMESIMACCYEGRRLGLLGILAPS